MLSGEEPAIGRLTGDPEAVQRELFEQMVEGAPLKVTLEALTNAVESRAPGLMASILLVENGRLRHGAAPSLPDGYNRAADGIPIGEGFGSCGTAAHRAEIVIVEDIKKDPLWQSFREIAARYGLGACWSTPILDASGAAVVVGTFALYYGVPRRPRREEMELVAGFSRLASLAIEYNRMREALAASKTAVDELVGDLQAMVWEAWDDQLHFVSVSEQVQQLLGVPLPRGRDQLAVWEALIHPEDKEATVRRMREALRRGGDYQCECRLTTSTGEALWVRNLVSVKAGPGGQGRRLRGIVLDISSQRKSELEREALLADLTAERTLLRAVLEQLPEGVCVVSPAGEVVLFNKALHQMLNIQLPEGTRIQETQNRSFADDGRPQDSEEWPVFKALRSGQPVEPSEMQVVMSDGGSHHLLVAAAPVRAQSGKVLAATTVVNDITEKKRMDALQRMLVDAGSVLAGSRDRLATARAVAAIAARQFADWAAIFTASEEGDLSCVALEHRNPAQAASMADLDRLVGQPGGIPFRVRSVVVSGQPELMPALGEDSFERGAVQAELVRLVRSMGAQSAITVPLTSPTRILGAMVFVAGGAQRFQESQVPVAQELARRVALSLENARLFDEAQRAVRHREEFLSIAAHELKTPLASLRLTIQTIAEQLDQPSLDLEFLRGRVKAGERFTGRMDRLMKELLDVGAIQSGRMRLQREQMNLSAVVASALATFKDELAAKKIDLAFHAGQPVMGWWDPARMEQVATNLISNAIKYGRGLPIRLFVEGAEQSATLQVEDEGLGIAPQVIPRLFQPFERGQAPGHYGGLGLGLHIADQIVRAHGGRISVRSNLGKGSAFTVELPRGGTPS